MIYTLLLLFMPIAHVLLLRIVVYRWLINSIIFPYKYFGLKRMLRRTPSSIVVKIWFDTQVSTTWDKKFWFGKKYLKMLEDQIIKTQ